MMPNPATGTVKSAMAFLILLAIPISLLGDALAWRAWQIYQADVHFAQTSVSVPATLVRYERWDLGGRPHRAGDIPVFMYTAADGTTRSYRAFDFGIANDDAKQRLAHQRTRIDYLPEDATQARIVAWHAPRWPAVLAGGLLVMMVGGWLGLRCLDIMRTASQAR